MIGKYLAPAAIRALSNIELRKEYSRLRSVANKRLQRMKAAGLGDWQISQFPKLKGLSLSEIQGYAADVARFLRDPRSTISGEKAFVTEELNDLRQRGYDFINESNFYDFIRFMETERQKVSAKVFDSGAAVDVFNEGQRLNIPSDVLHKHFDFFLEHYQQMEEVKPIKTSKTISFSMISRKMRKLEK